MQSKAALSFLATSALVLAACSSDTAAGGDGGKPTVAYVTNGLHDPLVVQARIEEVAQAAVEACG